MGDVTRRRVLGVGAVLLGAGACGVKTASADPGSPALNQRIAALETRYTARVGIFGADVVSGRVVEYRADDRFAMCSTFKTYAAACVLARCDRGELRLDDRRLVDPEAILPNSPVTEPQAGHEMTLGELCAAALQQSDNCAANLLLSSVGGPEAVTTFARSFGDDATRLDRWETELNSALPGDPRDTTTPRAFAQGYRTLLTGAVLEPSSRAQLDDWMRANVTSSMREGLPGGWTSADKTGNGDYGSSNDVGIAYGPRGQKLLLAMMTRSTADDPNAKSLRPMIAELTRQVVAALL